ncbi:hypothetical protein Poly24_52710 [Rosistilla carotiformis]|uniref:Uncharacterized protein n=1 Tax=Rosistilla carotiformis TaxID=2528017 RepID=A0A518K161_9BACT|nr:hypothetical protein [Rosistilla carotiformis]QDV71534.1 hypothetical protein Poly24_52710 [Rosistilla carotiformis]
MGTSKSETSLPRLGLGMVAVAMVAAGLWWWMRPPAPLSENGYDLTIALYRVCNQRSDEGLERIEQLLDESRAATAAVDPSHGIVAAIVAKAKAGDWEAAARASRQALEDQVKR